MPSTRPALRRIEARKRTRRFRKSERAGASPVGVHEGKFFLEHDRPIAALLSQSASPAIRIPTKHAASEDRTHDLRIMRPTRCQLRYRRSCMMCILACLLNSCVRPPGNVASPGFVLLAEASFRIPTCLSASRILHLETIPGPPFLHPLFPAQDKTQKLKQLI